ncbi:WxL domain-containing protein [Paenibacillus sp. GP183]|uniref:WxL domain-containing protein n=1 Tax=Paenibacillus sp. GP183 TaxID=1882751 RepID=UPI00089674AF|nr:WxL domain-containing protein [Paenibacillus sp. GP183]SEC04821.1 WxL domain surface cell wall-binding [Paenibacillus sp. GP183]
MFKQIKKALPIALVGVFAVASVAFAASSGVVNGGDLVIASNTDDGVFTNANPSTVVVSGISFNGLGTIDVSTKLASKSALDYLFVADNRGKNAGFVAKVSASPLTTTVPDSTAPGKTVTVNIPADSVLTVTAVSYKPKFTTKSDLAQVPTGTLSVGAAGIDILFANKGKGAGAFVAGLNYTLTLPNYLPTGSIVTAAPESAFKNVTDVTNLGLFAGSYDTTITYSITSAP